MANFDGKKVVDGGVNSVTSDIVQAKPHPKMIHNEPAKSKCNCAACQLNDGLVQPFGKSAAAALVDCISLIHDSILEISMHRTCHLVHEGTMEFDEKNADHPGNLALVNEAKAFAFKILRDTIIDKLNKLGETLNNAPTKEQVQECLEEAVRVAKMTKAMNAAGVPLALEPKFTPFRKPNP